MRRVLPVVVFLLSIAAAAFAQQQQFADLGDIKLQSGEVLRNCRIGYRTYGQLNTDKSNVILFPTWAGGKTEHMAQGIGAGRFADSTRYYVITVDALSNGVSSSPSNSTQQQRMKFPRITIRDMVETQHELLTRVLHIQHVKAVMGISMGGMQTFQWMVSYPDFMDVAIPIVGSPRLDAYDLVHWQTQLDVIMDDPAWKNGDYTEEPARKFEVEFGAILLSTPEYYNTHTTRQQAIDALANYAKSTESFDANNKIRQVQAMMALDVSEPFGGSMEKAAAAVKARTLVIASKSDQTVTPQPALDFARLMHATVVELDNDCGHNAPACSEAEVAKAISDFLGH